MRQKGFTLIELLVVIAIIAILAAILFPVFVSAKDRAHSASCLSNCKQLSMAHQAYMADNGGYTVPAYSGSVDGSSYTFWGWSLQSYAKNKAIFFCPSRIVNSTRLLNVNNVGYGINVFFMTTHVGKYKDTWFTYNHPTLKESDVRKPSNFIVFVDSDRYDVGPVWILPFTYEKPTYRHSGSANFAFMDGHAKSMKPIGEANKAEETKYWVP